MDRIKASDAKQNFAELLNRVAYAKETVVIEKYGKPVMVLSPAEPKQETKAEAKRGK